MRITAIADTHMRHDELVLETGDVLIVAGDICDRGTLLEVRDVARWLSEQPFEHVILTGGNHDSPLEDNAEACHRIFEEAGLIYLCDRSVRIGGLEFWGAPYTSMARSWAFGLGSEEALERVVPDPCFRRRADHTHAPAGDRRRWLYSTLRELVTRRQAA